MEPVAGLREHNKAKRREAILDGALAILRTGPLSALTTERVAALAEVSPATVYNLVGTREALLLALVDRVIEDLVTALADLDLVTDDDPIAGARLIVDRSVDAFTAEAHAYRQIVGAVGDFAATRTDMALDPAKLQVAAVREAQRAGVLRSELDAEAVGRQIYLTYIGAMFAWAGTGLTDEGLRIATRHGLLTVVAAAATDEHRARYLDELAALGAQLVEAGWGSPS